MCTENAHPSEYGAEGEEDGPQDVGGGVVVLVLGLGPGHAHDQEGQGAEGGPQEGVGAVQDDVVLPGLDGGERVKEPETGIFKKLN